MSALVFTLCTTIKGSVEAQCGQAITQRLTKYGEDSVEFLLQFPGWTG
jgi:hypothetical protein